MRMRFGYLMLTFQKKGIAPLTLFNLGVTDPELLLKAPTPVAVFTLIRKRIPTHALTFCSYLCSGEILPRTRVVAMCSLGMTIKMKAQPVLREAIVNLLVVTSFN